MITPVVTLKYHLATLFTSQSLVPLSILYRHQRCKLTHSHAYKSKHWYCTCPFWYRLRLDQNRNHYVPLIISSSLILTYCGFLTSGLSAVVSYSLDIFKHRSFKLAVCMCTILFFHNLPFDLWPLTLQEYSYKYKFALHLTLPSKHFVFL